MSGAPEPVQQVRRPPDQCSRRVLRHDDVTLEHRLRQFGRLTTNA